MCPLFRSYLFLNESLHSIITQILNGSFYNFTSLCQLYTEQNILEKIYSQLVKYTQTYMYICEQHKALYICIVKQAFGWVLINKTSLFLLRLLPS